MNHEAVMRRAMAPDEAAFSKISASRQSTNDIWISTNAVRRPGISCPQGGRSAS